MISERMEPFHYRKERHLGYLQRKPNFAFKCSQSFTQGGLVVARKTDATENKAMVNLINIAEDIALDLVQMMQYRVTDVCLPIFNINGTMRKAVKAKLCECFTFR